MILNSNDMAKNNRPKPAQRVIKGRGVASPAIPKAGITRERRRLECGGKVKK